MKKIYLFLLLCLCSCDALNLAPIDNYSLGNYWNTKDQCDRFIIGLHGRIRSRAQTYMIMGELRGGSLKTDYMTSLGQIASNYPIINNAMSLASPGLTNWANFYMDIMQINHAIEKLDNGRDFLNERELNYYLGQLYGMRAFYYFHLLRTWGGVPICDKADVLGVSSISTLNKPRATERQTLDFIKKDIDRSVQAFSEEAIVSGKNVSMWNKAASLCLRAEVYLWSAKVKPIGEGTVFSSDVEADLNEALESLLELEDKFTLNSSFATTIKQKDNKEMIFAIRYLYGEATNWFAEFTYPANLFTGFVDENDTPINNPISVASGSMRNEYKLSLYDEMDDEDSRKKATFFYFKKDEIEGVFLTKFIGEMYQNNRYFTDDYPIYRYSDVLLMLAEVYNALGGQQTRVKYYIERVRTRAYGQNFPVFSYTDAANAEEAILAERTKEFVAEGKLWYDKRRMCDGRYALELVDDNALKLLWPIDSGVLSKDSLVKQNEGYK